MGLLQEITGKDSIEELASSLDGQVDTVEVGIVYRRGKPLRQYASPEGWSITSGYTEPANGLGTGESEVREQMWANEKNVDDSELETWTDYLESEGFEVERRDRFTSDLGLFDRLNLHF